MMATDSISDNVAGMSIFSESMFKSPSGIDPFYSSGWNTMVSGNQTESCLENFYMAPQIQFAHPHYPVVLENQTIGSSSDLANFASDSGLVDMVPKIPSFGSGSLSEMVSSFGHMDESGLVDMVPKIPSFGSGSLSEMVSSFGHMDESGCHSNFPQNVGIQRASIKHGVLGALPNAKRKRKVPVTASCKNVEVDHRTDQTEDGSEFPKADEKKNKNIGANSGSKKTVNQAKDNSNGTESSKENYILVRAKRGQAINSHSLAERVRRERISERMRLLQELVPGCNKVTGKAVMLDEIINYVQSLQQQVEFLSMKLATVNPELNVDIEQILSKDLLYPRRSNATALGIGLELSSSHTSPGFPQGTIDCLPGTAPPLPQNLWNNELQSILQMGLDSDPSISSLHENGLSEIELLNLNKKLEIVVSSDRKFKHLSSSGDLY